MSRHFDPTPVTEVLQSLKQAEQYLSELKRIRAILKEIPNLPSCKLRDNLESELQLLLSGQAGREASTYHYLKTTIAPLLGESAKRLSDLGSKKKLTLTEIDELKTIGFKLKTEVDGKIQWLNNPTNSEQVRNGR